ncbi:hypothetical protein OGAPHI_002988 [Ogataea philodendri]|uniref:Uncharacterized protein n=1 Tax=Ogataea philodendri TaxID=1378263 RepID=A0A9P8T6F5_9ASCO|nr:uncharacterized protein OGAPHI_002988 [Ogataea philodendri]KAH3667339.1 hypothetical protein OGAPHI_002988 [Ogataea philodendri]
MRSSPICPPSRSETPGCTRVPVVPARTRLRVQLSIYVGHVAAMADRVRLHLVNRASAHGRRVSVVERATQQRGKLFCLFRHGKVAMVQIHRNSNTVGELVGSGRHGQFDLLRNRQRLWLDVGEQSWLQETDSLHWTLVFHVTDERVVLGERNFGRQFVATNVDACGVFLDDRRHFEIFQEKSLKIDNLMVLHLYGSAVVSGVTGLKPAETPPFEYTFRIQCTGCREKHDKDVSINLFEKHEIQGSRGEANFVFKCNFCGKHSNVEISLPKKYTGITPETPRAVFLDIEARGVDLVEFVPVGHFECQSEQGTKFQEVDLSEGEWYDYDDNAGEEVSVTEIVWEIAKKRGLGARGGDCAGIGNIRLQALRDARLGGIDVDTGLGSRVSIVPEGGPVDVVGGVGSGEADREFGAGVSCRSSSSTMAVKASNWETYEVYWSGYARASISSAWARSMTASSAAPVAAGFFSNSPMRLEMREASVVSATATLAAASRETRLEENFILQGQGSRLWTHGLAVTARAADGGVSVSGPELAQEPLPRVQDLVPAVEGQLDVDANFQTETLVKNWKKGKGVHNIYNLEDLFYTTDIQCDFHTSRLLSLNKNTGNLVTCNLNNGANVDTQHSTIPSGTTAYALGQHSIVFGRWDSKVYGSLVNHKNILLPGVKEYRGTGHRGMVTSVHVNVSELGKEGKIGALTGDENGNLVGWDVKKGVQTAVCHVCDGSIAKIKSNYKDVVVVLDGDGAIYIIRNLFSVFESTPQVDKLDVSLDLDPNHLVSLKVYVDYGDCNVILIDENRLEIVSYRDRLVRRLSTVEPIYRASLEQNSVATTKRDVDLVGSDPLLLALLLRSGKVLVVNVRSYEYEIRPLLEFVPKLAFEDDDYQRVVHTNANFDLPALSEVAVNSLVLAVGSYNGKVELYDVNTGEFFRKIAVKPNTKLLQLMGNQLLGIFNITLHQNLSAGIISYGSVVHFFKFGDFYKDLESKRKKKNFKERKYSNNHLKEAIKDYEFDQDEHVETLSRIDKYNGSQLEDSDEELQMALALSMSLNNSTANVDSEDEELQRAIELSKQLE